MIDAAPGKPDCSPQNAMLQLCEKLSLTIALFFCYAGLQLEAAKGSATAAQREELGCCRGYERAIWEAARSGSSPDKWLLREKVGERRGASAKGSPSEEVAHKEK